jgi:hypothetical protein
MVVRQISLALFSQIRRSSYCLPMDEAQSLCVEVKGLSQARSSVIVVLVVKSKAVDS